MPSIVPSAPVAYLVGMARTAAETRPHSDVAFSATVKQVQQQRGSRAAYAKLEQRGGFEHEVTDELQQLLSVMDSAFLASVNRDGQPYVQHRGGPPGFVRAVDDHTVGFLDFSGNRQYISTGNLQDDDRVCLLLVDYARGQRVKIWGRAQTVGLDDPAVPKLALPGYPGRPEQALLIAVTAWDVNCPRHIPRKLDAALVQQHVGRLEERIAVLQRDNEALRRRAGAR